VLVKGAKLSDQGRYGEGSEPINYENKAERKTRDRKRCKAHHSFGAQLYLF